MLDALLTAVGLGIAGIDPLGALLLMTAIAAKLSRSKLIFFNITVLLSAVIAGTIVSLVGAGFIASIKDVLPVSTSRVWVIVNLIVAAAILIWIVRRKLTKNRPKTQKPRNKLSGSNYTIAATGLLFGAGSVLDPTFLANISLAAQSESLVTIVAMHTIWILVSQIMLFGLFAAYLQGRHESVIGYTRRQYGKHKSLLQNILYLTAIAVCILLVSDSVSYLASGKYLINL